MQVWNSFAFLNYGAKNRSAKCSNMHILFFRPKNSIFYFASITKWNRSTVKIKLNLYETPTQSETWASILSVGFILTAIGYFFSERIKNHHQVWYVYSEYVLSRICRVLENFTILSAFSVFMGANKLVLIFFSCRYRV